MSHESHTDTQNVAKCKGEHTMNRLTTACILILAQTNRGGKKQCPVTW